MGLFVTVTDELICKQLAAARRQIIYAAPGISSVACTVNTTQVVAHS